MKIDLHTHSAISDGTQTPTELISSAQQAGLDVVALTDHDTTAGWDEATQAAAKAGVGLVRGMELSTKSDSYFSVHLLSYLHDPNDPGFLAESERSRRSRVERAIKMVQKLAVDFPISWEDVQEQFGSGTTLGRPHVADALVARGIVPDRKAAFTQILTDDGPYHVSHYAPNVNDAIKLVSAAGGVPVVAHPLTQTRGRVLDEAALEKMVESGLAGIEVDHRDHSAESKKWLRAFADHHGLIITGSSDYHGLGKPNHLGENTTDPQMFERIVELAHGSEYLPA